MSFGECIPRVRRPNSQKPKMRTESRKSGAKQAHIFLPPFFFIFKKEVFKKGCSDVDAPSTKEYCLSVSVLTKRHTSHQLSTKEKQKKYYHEVL